MDGRGGEGVSISRQIKLNVVRFYVEPDLDQSQPRLNKGLGLMSGEKETYICAFKKKK